MVSTVLALFSYKAEMERTSLGGEGLMVHSVGYFSSFFRQTLSVHLVCYSAE